jgi:hypothetical protein
VTKPKTHEKLVAELITIDDLKILRPYYEKARGAGVEIGCGFFDVYAVFEGRAFVGFRLDFTGT